MEDNNKKHSDIDALLSGIFKQVGLRERFDKRLHELGLSQTAAEKMLKIAHRTLDGILDGTQKRADTTSFQKIAVFLNMPLDEFIEVHASLAEKNFSEQSTPANKKKFIKEHFDLAVLRKAGFINSITDFGDIEKKIVSYFGFTSLFEYKKRAFNTAFWAGIVSEKSIAKTSITRDFWLTSAKLLATKIDNPHSYERQELVNFFPQIRWYSTNEEIGLIKVIKELYKLGITVIFQPRLSTLHLRGATFPVNNKPVIVLTDYKGFYPTLWHCLIHELYHVLFDWEEINKDDKSHHISDDLETLFTIDEREADADDFARRYLFSKEKMEEVAPFIYNQKYVNDVAKDNNVHPSIIHIYYAFDNSKEDRLVWVRAKRYMPDIHKCVYRLANPWENAKTIEEIAKRLKLEIYN